MADDNNASVLDKIDALSEDDIDKLITDLGIGDPEDGDGTPTDPQAQTVVDGQATGQEPKPVPESGDPSPKLSGSDLLDAFSKDPEAQKLVQSQIDGWLKAASANADAKAQSEEFQKLIEDGNFEEIGRRFVTSQQEQQIRSKVEEEALTRAYGEVYGKLIPQVDALNLTDKEKLAIDPKNFESDAEYVLALTNLIADKRSNSSLDELIAKGVDERLTTLKNMKTAATVNASGPSGLPGAVGAASNGPATSRSLLQEGFHDMLEEAANSRVNQE